MSQRMTGVVCAALAMVAGSAIAQETDLKTTNGAACVPVVAATGVPSTLSVVTPSGGRFSSQPGSISPTAPPRPPLMFVCPLVRDTHNAPYPVEVALRVNTYSTLSTPGPAFTCNLKIVDEQGNVVEETGDILIGVDYSSKVLSAGTWAVDAEHAYVLTCIVPNATSQNDRSGIISYKWSELSFF